MSAAVIGAGVGLSLGAAYLASGMGQAAVDHNRATEIAQATGGVLSDSALRQGLDASVATLAQPHDALAQGPLAQGARAAAQLAAVDPDVARIAAQKPTRARELDCLTQAVYFEARGESARGQAAVATVIMNRVKSPSFPKTVCDVVYQGAARRNGCQFSFACDGRAERVVERSAWSRARQVAARTLSGAVLGDIGSATHFHTTGVAPQWGPRMLRVSQVGLHVFYRFNPHGSRLRPQAAPEAPVFASAKVESAPELRLASAVLAPSAESAGTAAAAEASVPAAEPKADKPVAKADPASSPIARIDPPNAEAAAAS